MEQIKILATNNAHSLFIDILVYHLLNPPFFLKPPEKRFTLSSKQRVDGSFGKRLAVVVADGLTPALPIERIDADACGNRRPNCFKDIRVQTAVNYFDRRRAMPAWQVIEKS